MSKRGTSHKKIVSRTSNNEEYVLLQTDATGIIISASDQLSTFTGITNKQLVSSPLINITGRDHVLKLATFLKKGETLRGEKCSLWIKGERRNRLLEFRVHSVPGTNSRSYLLNWNLPLKKVARSSRAENSLAAVSQMFDANPQSVIVVDPESHEIVYSNLAACEFYGYPGPDFIGLSFADLLRGKETPGDTSISSGTFWFTRNGGDRVLVDLFVSDILVQDKTCKLIFTSVNYASAEHSSPSFVSEIKTELEKDYKDAWEILDNAPEIFFKLDAVGNFAFVSNEFHGVLGYSKAEMQGKHFSEIVVPEDLHIAQQGFADIFQFGRTRGNVIFRVKKKSGGSEWVSVSGIFIFDDEGRPVHCIGFAQVITDIKQLVEKLEASEERYAAFINQSSEAIWRFETAEPLSVDLPADELISEFITKSYLAECNDQMAKLYGFGEAADIIGSPFRRFLSPENDAEVRDYLRMWIQSGFKVVNLETNETDRDGNRKVFLNNSLGIIQNGKLVRVWGTQRDITEIRITEEKAKAQLEQSENFFKSLISDSLDGIIVLDSNATISYAASSITNVLGYLPEEVLGKNCCELIHPEDVDLAREAFDSRNVEEKAPFLELRIQSKSGDWLWMLVRANDLSHQPSVNGLVVYFTDITQRKHTENILKESEKRFRHLADTAPVMIWVIDENNKPSYVSKYWTDFTGVSLEAIISNGWKNIIHPDDYEKTLSQYKVFIEKKEPIIVEYRVRSRSGSYKWVVDHGVPRFTPDGMFMGYIGTVVDIHYRKTAEQKLLYHASMIENVQDVVISTDLDFNVISWNRAAEEIYGYTKEQALGKNVRSLLLEKHMSVSQEDILLELYEKDSWAGEVSVDEGNGKKIYLFLSLSFVKNEKGERIGLVGIHRNITQRYEAEIALKISEERYRSVVDALTEGIIVHDNQGRMIACNNSAKQVLGDDIIGSPFKTFDSTYIKEDGTPFTSEDDLFTLTLSTGLPLQGVIMGQQKPGNSVCWFSVNTKPIYYLENRSVPDAVVTSFFDITIRKQQEQLLSLEKEVLEINARPSATLQSTVDYYLRGIEKMFPDMICSIVMLRDDKQTIEHLSAPSLPVAFAKAINGSPIGHSAGSCGTAIFLKERVITSDISTDTRWDNYRSLAKEHNLQSCWSFPILNSQNDVIATIAVYHRVPKEPSEKELSVMSVTSNLLRIIFESKKAEASLRLSNERYLLATKATHDAIYDWDIVNNTVYRGESFYSLFGYSRNQGGGILDFLEEKLHPDDRTRVVKSLKRFVENKSADIWESEYRFLNAAGKYVVVYDRGFLIFSHDGSITRLVGSMMDITERKELERRLVKQEVDRQKMVAQAVVNAQEKERAEIGTELHDNVNQILSTARLYLELAKSDEKQRIDLINRSYNNIYDAINEIRSISRSLVPPSVGDLGLVESIEDLVESIRATKKIYIEFCYGGDIDGLLGQKQKLMLFRIIQEQVNNVLKHANARTVIIELMIDGHMINLAVSDDGKGFDFEEVKNNKGVGLQNIASRTELFNGKINIVTAPDKGCKLNIHVPISKI